MALLFFATNVLGDPIDLLVSEDATEEAVEALRQHYGYDRPMYVRFADFFGHFLIGDFDRSLRFRVPARGLVLEKLPNTAALALVAPALPLAAAPEEIRLWPGSMPGAGKVEGPERIGTEGAGLGAVSNVAVPRMRVYRPANPNGAAVLVAGGGGYFRIQLKKESTPAAEWLAAQGFTVFELIYRLPNDGWEASAPFMDAQRAMKIIRTRAADFGVDPQRIGIMGFSAGGHLAGFTAYQPARALYSGKDAYEAVSARPDFAVLLFPVVTLRKPYDTTRTRREIVGEKATEKAASRAQPGVGGSLLGGHMGRSTFSITNSPLCRKTWMRLLARSAT